MNKQRLISFLVILGIYILASIVGIIIYNLLDFHYAINLLIADVVATIVVFIFSLIFKNASIYDPYWSVQPMVITASMFINSQITLERVLVLIAVLLWGVRLTLNWAYTFKNLKHQDWRYIMLKEKTKKLYPLINFLGIHMFPTLVVYFCVLPIASMMSNETSFNLLVLLGFFGSIASFIIQGISDCQMHKFRKNKTGGFIRDGLWKYSRHPNYLGEILMWWFIAVLSISSIHNNNNNNYYYYYFLFFGAILNTVMFLVVSIPLAESHQSSRKEGFAEYKKATRMLLPIKK